MTNYSHGQQAERAAVEYLKKQGFTIRDTNWKTRTCEIDIVAEKQGTIHFVEVKYRQTNNQGTGLDYITPRKQKQMHYAAETWLAANNWPGATTLSAIELSGSDFLVTNFLEVVF